MAPAPRRHELSGQHFCFDLCIGGLAGTISKAALSPLYRANLVVNTQDFNSRVRSGVAPRFVSITNSVQRIYQQQGILAFWQGSLANLCRYVPSQALNLAFKDSIKKVLPRYKAKTHFLPFFCVNLSSGASAAFASLLITYPLDYVQTRFVADVNCGKRSFNGLGDCLIKSTQGRSGILSLWTGFRPFALKIACYRGMQLGSFDTLAGINPYRERLGFLGLLSTCFAAQIAVIVGAGLVYPMDTIKRRLEAQAVQARSPPLYRGSVDCFKKMVASEGVFSLYKGFLNNGFRSLGSALVLVLYDRTKTFLILPGASGTPTR